MQDLDTRTIVVMAAAWVLSVGLHEAGHAYSADRLGDPTPGLYGRLTLNPFAHLKPVTTAVILPLVFLVYGGGILGGAFTPINPSYFRKPLRDRVFVALAGPAVNFILAVLFALVWLAVGKALLESAAWIAGFFLFMVHLNLTLILFNMLSVPGLDGGDVLRYFLGPRARENFDGMRQYGIIIAILVLRIPGFGEHYFMPVQWAMNFLTMNFLIGDPHAR